MNAAQKSLNEYTDRLINDIQEIRKRKMDELKEEHLFRDEYMLQNQEALQGLSSEIKTLLDNQPETLHGVLKQYKGRDSHI